MRHAHKASIASQPASASKQLLALASQQSKKENTMKNNWMDDSKQTRGDSPCAKMSLRDKAEYWLAHKMPADTVENTRKHAWYEVCSGLYTLLTGHCIGEYR